jgi:hypothetical protein
LNAAKYLVIGPSVFDHGHIRGEFRLWQGSCSGGLARLIPSARMRDQEVGWHGLYGMYQ